MIPRYDSPEDAVRALVEAYQSVDIERIMAAKDFRLDAEFFWRSLGLPVDEAQLIKSTVAFKENFLKDFEEKGLPDYRSVRYSVREIDRPSSTLAVVLFSGFLEDKTEFELRLAVAKRGDSWQAVLHPAYDHL